MPYYGDIIDLVTGDTWKISRQINRSDLGLITNAWLTIKSDYTLSDANAEVFADISTNPNSYGLITNNEGEDEEYSITMFVISPSDTLDIDETIQYYFDIQVRDENGEERTVETGKLLPIKGITDAIS